MRRPICADATCLRQDHSIPPVRFDPSAPVAVHRRVIGISDNYFVTQPFKDARNPFALLAGLEQHGRAPVPETPPIAGRRALGSATPRLPLSRRSRTLGNALCRRRCQSNSCLRPHLRDGARQDGVIEKASYHLGSLAGEREIPTFPPPTIVSYTEERTEDWTDSTQSDTFTALAGERNSAGSGRF